MEKMTITEGLSVLKNINARIDKETAKGQFLATYQVGKTPTGYKDVDAFVQSAKSSFQSITDLIARRNQIKAAIVASNAVTNVMVGKQSMTVAAAIERKTSIDLTRNLLNTIAQQTAATIRSFEISHGQVQQRLDNLLEQNFGKDAKTAATAVQTITDDFMSRNEIKLCDPLNAKAVVDKLNDEINDFLTNVDVALSISNATTTITVD